jgi:hypothetical protein
MIVVRDNQLAVTTAGIDAVLQRCATAYVEKWTHSIESANIVEATEWLLAREFSWLSDVNRETARQSVACSTGARAALRFKETVANRIQNRQAEMAISFKRTLRVPDDGKTYPLPQDLDLFPIRQIERHANRVPQGWLRRGGVLIPIYPSEALSLKFQSRYPFAVKIGVGMVNALSGQPFQTGLHREPQDYIVVPDQPWLDGYQTTTGVVRQFIATRLGQGYTVEEQICSSIQGGLQFEIYPMKPESFFAKQLQDELTRTAVDVVRVFLQSLFANRPGVLFQRAEPETPREGLAIGGMMCQKIYEDVWAPEDWDLSRPSRVWVHLCNAARWKEITGEMPPQEPITPQEYERQGLQWFEYYRDDLPALQDKTPLANLKSAFSLAQEQNDPSIPHDGTITPKVVIGIGPDAPPGAVSEWDGTCRR